MKTGCMTNPTRRSETTRLNKKTVDGERSEGVLNMAANTKEFPMMAVSISGALKTVTDGNGIRVRAVAIIFHKISS